MEHKLTKPFPSLSLHLSATGILGPLGLSTYARAHKRSKTGTADFSFLQDQRPERDSLQKDLLQRGDILLRPCKSTYKPARLSSWFMVQMSLETMEDTEQ